MNTIIYNSFIVKICEEELKGKKKKEKNDIASEN